MMRPVFLPATASIKTTHTTTGPIPRGQPTGTRTGLSYIPPGSPWLNGYVESFNSRIRDECLNINSFYSLLHAQVVIGDWKVEYNLSLIHI